MNMLDLDTIYEVQEQPVLFMRPGILSCPPIPKALNGVNPRTIKGKGWWDKQRKAVYKQNNYHCFACGVWEKKARPNPWLDAHEIYRVSTKTGRVTLKEIVAICPACHKFIHLSLVQKQHAAGIISYKDMQYIVIHGLDLVRSWKVPILLGTLQVAEYMLGFLIQYKKFNIRPPYAYDLEWDKWHLVLDGKKYRSKFKDEEEWRRFYNKQGG